MSLLVGLLLVIALLGWIFSSPASNNISTFDLTGYNYILSPIRSITLFSRIRNPDVLKDVADEKRCYITIKLIITAYTGDYLLLDNGRYRIISGKFSKGFWKAEIIFEPREFEKGKIHVFR